MLILHCAYVTFVSSENEDMDEISASISIRRSTMTLDTALAYVFIWRFQLLLDLLFDSYAYAYACAYALVKTSLKRQN